MNEGNDYGKHDTVDGLWQMYDIIIISINNLCWCKYEKNMALAYQKLKKLPNMFDSSGVRI